MSRLTGSLRAAWDQEKTVFLRVLKIVKQVKAYIMELL